ncbi:citrulline utilization hydrolase CtlX [Sphingomicrobium arenosum]|uniref:citrulline utilization hydrolase CtlX n=1 Tax=Sphingomicrobium arenosum TaxID=2233861 RepID=UPI00223F6828|nr:arginine deiminase-related protein [Sphingomicrobium arenosum]
MTLPPSSVLMVRPHHFALNPETLADNGYQSGSGTADAAAAHVEVTAVAAALRAAGVEVLLFEDEDLETPDSVFPNNWVSVHPDGTLVTYPMRAPNRRRERRGDIVAAIEQGFHIERRLDLSPHEAQGRFLEGTGAIVFDHDRHLAFATRSGRCDEGLLRELCAHIDYRPIAFTATRADGTPVYHTNVMMALGSGYALVGLDMLRDPTEREALVEAMGTRDLVMLEEWQVDEFAGNAFELAGRDGPLLTMSERAAAALRGDQRAIIERHARLLSVAIPTIEQAGGSLRCMLAAIEAPPRA